ncbi:MFS transporter [Sciscionella sediminilitoris]|uniref:MFS transporter n=1 Tax=Sciscionella sediminilitoris TaxID=1445613 RepID=UPI0006920532|nr:MFS transporter [Sciscionella sp. SE31]
MSTTATDRRVITLLAITTGVVIANVYYAQPLADALAQAMRVPTGSVGVVLTLIQLGYAVGLATLVPLGDLVERRRLLAILLTICVLGLAGMALAPGLAVLEAAAVLVGATSVVAQIIVPFAAHLAAPHEQGRVVSTVMSGLLLGILASRTVAGLLAELAGWRAVFALGAAATALVGFLACRRLPRIEPSTTLSYPRLLASVLELVRTEPVLRLRMLFGALAFAAFSTFWASMGFLLARPPYSWSEAAIGAFALVGIAGAVMARVAGSLADRGHAWRTTGAAFLIIAVSFLLMGSGGHNVLALVLGVVLLDLGCQGAHISNQGVIYRLRPGAHSRITTAYMTVYFIAGALGSGLSSVLVYPRFGWTGVCALGGAFAVFALIVWGAATIMSGTKRIPR